VAQAVSETSLFNAALACLVCADADEKIALSRQTAANWSEHRLSIGEDTEPSIASLEMSPGIPDAVELVHPFDVPKRKVTTERGKRAFLHAIAHIEFNAVNLAWDCVWRFRGMPRAFYDDWVRVAAEEAEHFAMLAERLEQHECSYGDLPAHNGLWEMAEKTSDNLCARMAMVPRYLEARGLDVTPGMIARMDKLNDERSAEILRFIYEQEIGHVEVGTRWFRWACEADGVEPDAEFARLIEKYLRGHIKGPFNMEARRAAGFSPTELARLESAGDS
jgi:uncharacterized ferritin-like protein (DUF455 family)